GFGYDTPRSKFKLTMEEKGEVIGLESCWKRKDGSEIFVRENAKAIKNSDGTKTYYEGSVEDITERKKVEEALQSHMEFNYKLIQNTPVFFVAISAEGKTVMMNDTMLNATGYTKEEVLEKNYTSKFIPEKDRETLAKVFEQIVKNRERTLNENHILTKDNRELLVEWHGTPIFTDDGKFDFFIGMGIDITERTRTKEALHKSEEKYKSLYENATVGIYRTTPDGKLLMANAALLAIYGFSSFEELSRVNAEDIYFDPAQRTRFKEILESEGTVYGYESVGKKADGSKFYFLDSAKAIKDEDGKTIYYEGVVQDITDKKLALELLTESEKKFRLLIEQAPDGIFRLDSEGNFILANTKTCELLGYNKEEILNLNIIETYTSPEEQEIARQRLKQIKAGSDLSFERLMKRKDGKSIPVTATVKGLENGSQAIIHDISNRKRSEFLQNAVYQISEATGKANTLDDLYKSIHEIIGAVLPAKNFFISLYDSEKDLLTFPYFVDEIDSPPGPVKAGRGYTAYVLRTGKSVFYDEELDKRLKGNGDVETVGTDSPAWIGVPLIVDSETIGAMVVQHYSDPDAYDENDLHLLEYVSSQTAKAIVNKRAEVELRKLSSAVKQSSAALVITDILGNIEYVNPKFTEITGYSPEEVKGRSTRILKSGLTSLEVYKELWATIKEGKEWKGELRNRKKNGGLYWESSSISPIRDTAGKITHFLAVKEDITKRKRIQRELIESKEKAEEMSRLKSTFMANMSHELRTPLVGILGYAEIIHNDIKDREQKEMMNTIITSGNRLMNTLNSILDLSKIEAEKNDINLVPVEISSVVAESIRLFKVVADKKNL
ncbi:PAS domain S-box protein, partial [Bacteroidota bacterium]